MGGAQSTIEELTGPTSGKYYSDSDGVHMAGDEDLDAMIEKIRSEDKGKPPDWGLNSKAWQNMRAMNGPSQLEKTVSSWGLAVNHEEEEKKLEAKRRKSELLKSSVSKSVQEELIEKGTLSRCKRCSSVVQTTEVGTYTNCPVLGDRIEIEDLHICLLLNDGVAKQMETEIIQAKKKQSKRESKRLKREAKKKKQEEELKAAAEERMRREKLGEQMRREQELQDQEQAELEKAELEARKKWQDSDFDAAGWFKPEPPTVRKRSAHALQLEWEPILVGGRKAKSYVLLGKERGYPSYTKRYSGPGRRYTIATRPGCEYHFKVFGRTEEDDSMHSDPLVVTAPMLGGVVSPLHRQSETEGAAGAAASTTGSTAASGSSENGGSLVGDIIEGDSIDVGNREGNGEEGEESTVETEAERNVQRLQEELATLRRRRSQLEAAAGIGEQQQQIPVQRDRPSLHIDTNAEQLGFVPITSTAGSHAVVSSPFTPAIYGRSEDLRSSVFEYQAGDAASAALAGYGGEMPTEPVRIAQLDNGWIECYDPESGQVYYYNPRTEVSQWERPPPAQQGDEFLANLDDLDDFAARGGEGENSGSIPPNLSPKRSASILGSDSDKEFRMKRMKFLWSVRQRGKQIQDRLEVKVRRDHVLHDSFRVFHGKETQELMRKTRVEFQGEVGIDSGGLSQEWYLLLSRELLKPSYCLFVKQQGETYHVDARSQLNDEHISYFRFAGQILAKAILDRKIVGMHLSRALLKALVGKPLTLNDLESADPMYHQSLKWMLRNDITDVLEETFSIAVEEFGATKVIELVKGGSEIEVTEENKKKYISSVVKHKLYGSVKKQIQALLQGFYSLIAPEAVQVFEPEELDKILCGKGRIDAAAIQRCARYQGGYTQDSPVVQMFWLTFRKMKTEERSKVLAFITGSGMVPLDGFDPAFTITKASNTTVTALPTAHTCFNQLVLPEYGARAVLEERLHVAIEEGGGFHMT